MPGFAEVAPAFGEEVFVLGEVVEEADFFVGRVTQVEEDGAAGFDEGGGGVLGCVEGGGGHWEWGWRSSDGECVCIGWCGE